LGGAKAREPRSLVWQATDNSGEPPQIAGVGEWSGLGAVLAYRLYHVVDGGRLRLGDAFQAPDDPLAIEKARLLRLVGGAAELWQEGRIVGRFSKSGGYAPAR
jgi:hypothetical protein